jgi:ribosomal 30S subunit maturation factor RimM
VIDQRGAELGRVQSLMTAGAADVMVITGPGRILVPFILNDTVTKVDLRAGVIEVNWEQDD